MIRGLLSDRENLREPAVIEDDGDISYGALITKSHSLMALLPLGRREVAVIFLPDGGDFIAAFWGVLRAGLTAYPINTRLTATEIAPLIHKSAARTVITHAAHRPLFEEIRKNAQSIVRLICMDELPGGGVASPPVVPEADPDEAMVLLGTSGTTGNAKIVRLSERNVHASVMGYLAKVSFDHLRREEIRYLLAAPFSSVYAIMILSACLMNSFPVVIPDAVFTLTSLYQAAERHCVTHYEGSATPILLMEQTAGRPIPYDIHTLRYFGFGGSKVSGSVIERVLRAYPNVELFQGYGMTEAAPLIAKHPPGTLIKTDSVGSAILGTEIAIEADGGVTTAPHIPGEVLVKGPGVMLGYLHDEAETRRVLRNGYLHTGDIGYLDEAGYLYLCGRKKNLIIVRGFNVFPEEVEDCIRGSALARDCHVYGEMDESGNETVCAEVVPLDETVTAEAIRAHCRIHLAAYKQPQRISFCADIERNASGKIERRR